ncbi:MAG: hypothetical protein VX223_13975 [Myxococcota bacterium]|nr:hypothetical protein [Myxococcota bacterium]
MTIWVVEVLSNGAWELRNGPLPSYDMARACINEKMVENNRWRIRGGIDVMDTVVEPTLPKAKKKASSKTP